jgi:streptogramin lyase
LTTILAACLTLLGVVANAAAAAPTITEFPVPTHDRGPFGIADGPDGNVWFAESAGGGIGRATTSGSITEFTTGISGPAEEITAGSDGNLWFTEPKSEKIGRITPAGTITEFSLPKGSQPAGIAAGSDGNLWFTVPSGPGGIGRITPEGGITLFTIGLTPNAKAIGIAAGPDGNLWFTETANPGRIGRITTTGTITEYSVGLTANAQPESIASGPDGSLWFTERADPGRIGRITTGGAITEYSAGLTANSQPEGITAGDDGNLYFSEFKDPGRIGRITTAGSITELATPTIKSQPGQLATGPDGNVWFTELGNHGQIAMLTVPPSVGAITPSNVVEQAATFTAPVGANSQASSYYFEYGTTKEYGVRTALASAGSGSSPAPVSATVGSLAAGTVYHVRAVAENASGTTYGPDQTLQTTLPPAATTQPAAAVTLISASLRGAVNPEGQATTYHFDWGPTSSYGSQVPASDASVGSDAAEHALEQALAGLAPDTTYHYRVVASNCGGCGEGTTYGADEVFTTAPPPNAQTGAATAIGRTKAMLTGVVDPHGASTDYYFDWGETSAYGQQTPTPAATAGADNTEHDLSATVQDLLPGTAYHYRIVATNCGGCPAGTSYGADMTFTTESAPLATIASQTSNLGEAIPATAPATLVAPPALGRTALARSAGGRVLIRTPGSSAARPLGSGAADIPMGSTIDASHGIVTLATAINSTGQTQSATLWGGTFVLRQATAPPGMTTFTLAATPGCPRHSRRAGVAVAAANKSGHGSRLWAKDNHGHFSTRGHNSVATVRGTEWATAESCAGTLTIVKRGAVSVRDLRRHRSVVVRAGRSYLARS